MRMIERDRSTGGPCILLIALLTLRGFLSNLLHIVLYIYICSNTMSFMKFKAMLS